MRCSPNKNASPRNNVGGARFDNNCVCDVVREIVAAQNDVNKNDDNCCNTSCERSINQLLSPAKKNNDNGLATIPFVLYCKEDCKPFFASGIFQDKLPEDGGGFFYDCLKTPIFKAKKFVEGSECCVKLELMLPADLNGQPQYPGDNCSNVCEFFDETAGNRTTTFAETGICITVDLNCFSAIQCLDAVPSVQMAM